LAQALEILGVIGSLLAKRQLDGPQLRVMAGILELVAPLGVATVRGTDRYPRGRR
jgi:hypothetical protein